MLIANDNLNNDHTFYINSYYKTVTQSQTVHAKHSFAKYKIIHKHIGGRTAKLPNDTYNRIHASNNDTHIKHLYNNETANINRYIKYNKEKHTRQLSRRIKNFNTPPRVDGVNRIHLKNSMDTAGCLHQLSSPSSAPWGFPYDP